MTNTTQLIAAQEQAVDLVNNLKNVKITTFNDYLNYMNSLGISHETDTCEFGSGGDCLGYNYTKNIIPKKLYIYADVTVCFDNTLYITVEVRKWLDYDEIKDETIASVCDQEFFLKEGEEVKFLKFWGESLDCFVVYKGNLTSTAVRLDNQLNFQNCPRFVYDGDGNEVPVDFNNPDFQALED